VKQSTHDPKVEGSNPAAAGAKRNWRKVDDFSSRLTLSFFRPTGCSGNCPRSLRQGRGHDGHRHQARQGRPGDLQGGPKGHGKGHQQVVLVVDVAGTGTNYWGGGDH
jgi:hypothetical protein